MYLCKSDSFLKNIQLHQNIETDWKSCEAQIWLCLSNVYQELWRICMQAENLTWDYFMDKSRRYSFPGSKPEDFITHSNGNRLLAFALVLYVPQVTQGNVKDS